MGRPQRGPAGDPPGFRLCYRGRAGGCPGPPLGQSPALPRPFAPTRWRHSTAHPPPPRPPIGCARASPWQRAGNKSLPLHPSAPPAISGVSPQTLPFPFSVLPGLCPEAGGGGGVSSGGEAPTRVCVKAGPEQEDRSGGKGGETGAKPKSRCDRGRAEPFAKAASVTPPLPDPNTRRFLLPLPLISFLFHHPNPRAGGCCAVCGPRCPFRGNSVTRNSPRENAVAVSKVDRQVLAWSGAAACDSNIWLA